MKKPSLIVGAFGREVSGLQSRLRALGFKIPEAEVNRGFFGPATRQAVIAFQKKQGLTASGAIDEGTAKAINIPEQVSRTEPAPKPQLATPAKIASLPLTQAPTPLAPKPRLMPAPKAAPPMAAGTSGLNLGKADLTRSVLDSLKAGSPARGFVNHTLNSVLKTTLATAATKFGQNVLANLVQQLPAVDIAAAKDLSLQDFVIKKVTLPADPSDQAMAKAAIAKISTKTTVGDLLGVTAALKDSPIFAGEIKKIELATLLKTSPGLAAKPQLADDFIGRYAASTGSMADFWQTLSQDPEFKAVVPELQLALQLGTLTLGNPPLVAALRARYPKMTSPRALATMSATDWEQLITAQHIAIPASIAGATPTEQASNYAATITGTLATAFPGAIFGHALQQAVAGSEQAVDRGVASVLDNASDFDILDTNLSSYIAQNGPTLFAGIAQNDQTAVTERLATWQRVARVTSDFPTATKLVTAGYTSAYAIACTPRASFLNAVSGTLDSASTAAAIFGRAQQISGTAMAMFANVRQALTGVMPRAIGDMAGPVSTSLNSPAGIPNWQTLFGPLSSCACADCQSVYSASAYFVDLLQFLANSKSNTPGQTALQALFVRRPDLQYIKLNCTNTNTELPYVDLVNEIMESFVTLSSIQLKATLDATTAHDTSKSATAADLSVSPEYTLDDAYNTYLNTALYPPTLPFDRWLLTARTYLGFLGSSLYEVMETCQTGSAPAAYTVPLADLPNITVAPFAGYDAAAHTLSVGGVMSAEAERALLTLSPALEFTTAVEALYNKSQKGGAFFSVPLARLPSIVLPLFATYDNTAHTLSVTGAMTLDAENDLLALSTDPGYRTAVNSLYAASQQDVIGGTPSKIAIACEYLTISNAECLILTGKDFQGQPPPPSPSPPQLYQYYGYSTSMVGSSGTSAAITYSESSWGVVTLTAANSFVTGQFVLIEGLTNAAILNGSTLELTNVTPSSLSAVFWPTIPSAPDAGTATLVSPATSATITGSALFSNVVTLTATNSFVPGEYVVIEGLTNAAALNGSILQVVTATSTSFTANFQYADIASAFDAGTATLSGQPWEQVIANVETFLQNTAIEYDDLVALLKTRALNPTLSIFLLVNLQAASISDVCDLSQTTIVDLSISNGTLQDETLDRTHRFIRLWQKLGWAISDLDKTMTALEVTEIDQEFLIEIAAIQQLMAATGLPLLSVLSFWATIDTDGRDSLYLSLFQNPAVVNPPALSFQLTYVAPLTAPPILQLPSPVYPNLKYEDAFGTWLLSLSGAMSPAEYDQLMALSSEPSFVAAVEDLYTRGTSGATTMTVLAALPPVMLPANLVGPSDLTYNSSTHQISYIGAMSDDYRDQFNYSSDPGYQAAIDAVYEMRTLFGTELASASTSKISDNLYQIQGALRISSQDLAALLTYKGLANAAAPLDLANLSTLTRYALLAQGLGLSVSDLLAAITLIGADPFVNESPTATLGFVQTVQTIQASPFTIAQLNYLYQNIFDPNGGIAPVPGDMNLLLTTLQAGLAAIANANAIVPDPKGALLAKALGTVLGSALANAAIGLIIGTGVYSAALAAVPVVLPAFVAYNSTTQTLSIVGAMTAVQETQLFGLSADPAYQAAVASLYQASQAGGGATYTQPLTTLPAIGFPTPTIVLPPFVSYSGATQTLSIVGAMTAAQETQLIALSTDPTYQAAVASLYQASQAGGGTAYTQSLPVLPPIGFPTIVLPPFVSYSGATQTLSIVGAMTSAQETQLFALSADPPYQAAVTSLYQASQAGGNTTYTQSLPTLPAIRFPTPPSTMVYDSAAQMLRITGPMTASLETAFLALSSDPAYQAAVQNLRQQQIDFINTNLAAFLNPADAVAQLIDSVATLSVADKVAYVAAGLMPYLTQIQSVSLITQTLSDNLSLNPQLCDLLLNTILNSQVVSPAPPGSPRAHAMADYLALVGDGLSASYYATVDLTGTPVATRVDSTVNFNWGFGLPNVPVTARPFSVRWTGYVMPQYSETYTFYVQACDCGGLWVNGVNLIPSWADGMPSEHSGTTPAALTAGKLYTIELDYYDDTASAGMALSWSSSSTPKAIVPQSQLFSGVGLPLLTSLTPIVNSYILLFKTNLLISTFSLTAADVTYLYNNRNQFEGINPGLPSAAPVPFDPNLIFAAGTSFTPAMFNQWQRLNAVVKLRNTLPGSDAGLLNIFNTASHSATNTKGTLSSAVSEAVLQATNWNATDLAFLASTSAFGLSDADFTNELGTQGSGLVRLQACAELFGRLGVSALQLFTWSAFGPDAGTEETNAQAIQNTVKAKYDDTTWVTVGKPLNDTIREASKEALIAYILAHAASWGMKAPDDGGQITLADQLYEYFLIDVEMSPCMLTSRIVQASAAVQLFVQRCLLNLEQLAVSPAMIDNVHWSWMQNFRVWQANRMVLNYPENWIVPTLRDDQTPLFQTFANALLQNPMTEDNVEQAYLDYLYGLNAIARLDIRASYWQLDPASAQAPDGTADATNDVLHVFARTNAQPYVYYYRRLLNCSQNGQTGGGAAWTPWESVDASIEGDHLIPVFWDGRLFLFWPAFLESAETGSQSPIQIPQSGDTVAPPVKDLSIKLYWSEYRQGAWSPKQSSDPWAFNQFTNWLEALGTQSVDALDTSQFSFKSLVIGEDSLLINVLFNGSYIVLLGQFTFSSCGSAPAISPSMSPQLADAAPKYQVLNASSSDAPPQALNMSYNFLQQGANTGPLALLVGYVEVPPLMGGPVFGSIVGDILTKTPNDFWLMFPQQYWESLGLIVPPSFPAPPITKIDGLVPGEPFFYEDSHRVYFVTEGFSMSSGNVGDSLKESAIYGRGTLTSESNQVSAAAVFPNTGESLLGRASASAAVKAKTSIEKAPTTNPPVVPDKHVKGPEPVLSQILFSNHFHPFSCTFIKEVNRYGLAELLTLPNQALINDLVPSAGIAVPVSVFFETYGPVYPVAPPYPLEQVDFSPSSAYSIYNWELFFHMPVLIATQFDQNQQFDDAETWWRYVFNPTTSSTDPIPQRYWQFLPFYRCSPSDKVNGQVQNIFYPPPSGGGAPPPSTCGEGIEDQIAAWQEDPFNPFLIARMRPVAFRMYVVMQYIQHHISYGDFLFGQNTRESINEATLHYVLAQELLGPQPVQIPARGTAQDYTYNDLVNLFGLDSSSNALVLLENDFPYLSGSGVSAGSGLGSALSMSSIIPYFCFTPNDTLTGLWSTVEDRLYKIRHCMNIQGVVEQLPLFSPPISPALLVAAEAAGVSLSSVLSNTNAGVPFYRFTVMVQKALELCSEVRALGAALLAALERQDAEALELLRATQEGTLLQAMQQMKQYAVQEATATLASLNDSLTLTIGRQQWYQSLIAGGLTSGEQQYLNEISSANSYQQQSVGDQLVGSVLGGAPQFDFGIAGAGGSPKVTTSFGGQQLAMVPALIAKSNEGKAAQRSYNATSARQNAEWDRRSSEWGFQLSQVTQEIVQIKDQIAAANFRVEIAQADEANLTLQIQNAQAVQNFLQTKYTNTELYSWMVDQTSTVFFQCYQMAYDLATQAEVGFRFERGLTTSSYIQFGYWDSLKKGLLSGERLYADLKRMELAYLKTDVREYEITKAISLVLFDPWALINLKTTGQCFVNLPEAYYDQDYPGHYFRRIRTVSLTIPCVSGPYTSVNCTLTLLNSKVRVDNTASSKADFANDAHFVTNYAATQSIATSTAQNDPGLFEVNFRDERYLPFEGAGAISTWQIDLPIDCNAFDFDSISDVVINLRYTSRYGGDLLRDFARPSALLPTRPAQAYSGSTTAFATKQTALQRLFSLKHEFPSEWYKFLNPPDTATSQSMSIALGPERFPFQYRGAKTIKISQVEFVLLCATPALLAAYPPAGPLVLQLGPPNANQPSSVQLVATPGVLSGALTPAGSPLPGAPYGSISQPAAPGAASLGAPPSWTLQVSPTSVNAPFANPVPGTTNFHLNPAAIDDIFMICHYTPQYS